MIYRQVFLTFIARKSLKINCALKSASDLKNDFTLIRFAFEVRQKFEAVPRGWKSFLGRLDTRKRYNKYLTNLVFLVRTVSYGSSFIPLRSMARAIRAWAMN